MSSNGLNLSPVGKVIARNGDFAIQISAPYLPALKGLAGFSHLNVLWWSHFLDAPDLRAQTVVNQPYQKGPAELGIFATRSPMRPNPICLSVAPVIHVDETSGLIHLAYIDAEDGTPVLDVKPYLPCSDRVRQVSTPAWNSHWPQCFEDSAEFDWEAEFVNAQ
jgi:tRNA-Thr(GGU) m(6)t(6)A37 methyltransferase TsaA